MHKKLLFCLLAMASLSFSSVYASDDGSSTESTGEEATLKTPTEEDPENNMSLEKQA